MQVQHFFDDFSSTLTYVVYDEDTKDAVIIDPVLDYDPVNLTFSQDSLTTLLQFVKDKGLNVHYALETHIHADHITGADALRAATGIKLVAGAVVPLIQETFTAFLDMEGQVPVDGSQFDVLLADGEELQAGSITIKAIATPGHTPADTTYQIGDAIFTGDTMFMPDFGTGRCDFPNGSAEDLYDSIVNRLYTLPDETRVFVGHDYQPGGRELKFMTTIGESKASNKQLRADTSKEEFVKWRTERDATLNLPRLIFQSVQLNIDAGKLPEPNAKGHRFLKTPIL